MSGPSESLSRRLNDLNAALVVTLGRYEEALAMLKDWADEHPEDETLVRMTRSFILRCEVDAR